MPFPERSRSLLELREEQVVVPDYVWLSYAVCAVDECSCEWQGWIIESAWKRTADGQKENVIADDEQKCPMCNGELFRTEVEKQFQLNPNAGPKIDYEYESAPMKFTKKQPKQKQKLKKASTRRTKRKT